MRVLLLGGTSEARELAAALVAAGVDVTSSLAGRVAQPRLPVGPVRIGGFGGVDGLRAALADFEVVVDATHPFALGMSANALVACNNFRPLLRLERTAWPIDPAWCEADTHADAAAAAARLGRRPFITVGRQELATFIADLGDHAVLARVVDTPDVVLPRSWELITSRGPYSEASERDLLRTHRSDVLITKNSGGSYTWPKLAAAQELGVNVVMIRRPARPPQAELTVVSSVDEAIAWVQEQL